MDHYMLLFLENRKIPEEILNTVEGLLFAPSEVFFTVPISEEH